MYILLGILGFLEIGIGGLTIYPDILHCRFFKMPYSLILS